MSPSHVRLVKSKKNEDSRFKGFGPSVNGLVFSAAGFIVHDECAEMLAAMFNVGSLGGGSPQFDAVYAASELDELLRTAFGGNEIPAVGFVHPHLVNRLGAIPSGGAMAFGAALTRFGIRTLLWPDPSVPTFDHWLVSHRDPAATSWSMPLGARLQLGRRNTLRVVED